MKHIRTTIGSLLILASFGLTLSATISPAPQAYAACTASSTSGNLAGHAVTDNLGNIYMSTEAWNAAFPSDTTTIKFSVEFDRETGYFSGRGWNEDAGWVNFSYDITGREALFEVPPTDPEDWGNWNGLIDLSNVTYSTSSGSFVGLGSNAEYTGGDDDDDDLIGAGDIDFSTVTFKDADDLCPESVNLFLNNRTILQQTSCDISAPTIAWTTEGITTGTCEIVEGLWGSGQSSGDSITDNNTTGETASGAITTANSPVSFRIKCTGDTSGDDVYGTAIAKCGIGTGGDDTGGGTGVGVNPDFKEV